MLSNPLLLLLIIIPALMVMVGFMVMILVVGGMGKAAVSRRRPTVVPLASPVLSPKAYGAVRDLLEKGKLIHAVKLVREETGLGLKDAKAYAEAIRDGRIPPPSAQPDSPPAAGGLLSERVRAFRDAGDHDAAVALVRAETGMSPQEAARFVAALD